MYSSTPSKQVLGVLHYACKTRYNVPPNSQMVPTVSAACTYDASTYDTCTCSGSPYYRTPNGSTLADVLAAGVAGKIGFNYISCVQHHDCKQQSLHMYLQIECHEVRRVHVAGNPG